MGGWVGVTCLTVEQRVCVHENEGVALLNLVPFFLRNL